MQSTVISLTASYPKTKPLADMRVDSRTIPTLAKRGRPATLSTAEVVDAALALIDEVGLDSLTMRSLAAALGVGPMTLYRHVADKRTLLALIPDVVLAPVCEDVLRKRSALTALKTVADGVARELEHNPSIARLFDHPELGQNMAAAADHTVQLLMAEGISETEAWIALSATVAQVIGQKISDTDDPDGLGVRFLLEGIRLRIETVSHRKKQPVTVRS